jgi:hypothetical protein
MIMAAVALLPGCLGGEPDALETIQEISAPAGAESGQPNLAAGTQGLYLSWNELSSTGEKSVKFALKTPGGWSEPQTIVTSDRLLVNWADFPSVIDLPGGVLAAHWLTTMPDLGGYGVHVALSKDQGKSWSAPVVPHRDGSPVEHGFVSLIPDQDGVGVIWLDSRKLGPASTDVALMYTRVGAEGTLGAESEIDPRVCECCQPASVAVEGGSLTVYRDRSGEGVRGEEIRDIVITRFDGKGWSAPRTVFDDNWKILACPIQGPAISAAGAHVAVAWFTGANDTSKVQVALSSDGGKTFGSPVQVNEADPVGRVDVVTLNTGGAIVTWIEHTERGGELRARQIDAGGRLHDAQTVGKASLGSASGFPRVERAGDTIVFAWTDTENRRVRTAVAGKQ